MDAAVGETDAGASNPSSSLRSSLRASTAVFRAAIKLPISIMETDDAFKAELLISNAYRTLYATNVSSCASPACIDAIVPALRWNVIGIGCHRAASGVDVIARGRRRTIRLITAHCARATRMPLRRFGIDVMTPALAQMRSCRVSIDAMRSVAIAAVCDTGRYYFTPQNKVRLFLTRVACSRLFQRYAAIAQHVTGH